MAINISNFIEWMIERVAESNPDIDTREHTAFHDTNIKPNQVILQPLVDAIQEIQDTKSLIDLTPLTDDDVDKLVANLVITRRTGSKAGGTVRVYFDAPQSVSFLEGTAFISKTGLRFEVPTTTSIDEFSMRANVEGNLYFVDVNVLADSESGGGNLAVDDIVDVEGGPTEVVRVTNKSAFTGGSDRETNAQLVDRAKLAISVRNLVTKPSIETVLLAVFPAIRSLGVVGYGDVEMERDKITGTGMSLGGINLGDATALSIGGKVDIYVVGYGSLETTSEDLLAVKEVTKFRARDGDDPPGPLLNVTFLDDAERPVIEITKVEELDPGTGEPSGVVWVLDTDYIVESEETSLTFSNRDRMRLRLLDTSKVGADVRVTYKTSDLVQDVQAYVENTANRVVTADILTKHAVPATLNIIGSVRLNSESSGSVTADDLQEALKDRIEELTVGSDIEVSDFIELLYLNGCEYVQLPLNVTVDVVDVNGVKTTTTITDTYTALRNEGVIPGTITITVLS